MTGKHLITTNDWFVAPDGNSYKAAWGDVEILGDEVLGLKTNRNSANWFAKIGDEDNHVIVAGCQIYYAVRCEEEPSRDPSNDWAADAANGKREFNAPCRIYFATQSMR